MTIVSVPRGAGVIRPWTTGPRAETAIGLALLIVTGAWGALHWNRAFMAGVRPAFYQHYFEPAVMIACGHGFATAVPEVPAMGRFLRREADRFRCDEIPAGIVLQRDGLFQKSWWYLMYAVGVAWRVFGVSWSGMSPLFGALFGATIVAAYAIFRLGMDRILALLCSVGLSLSPLHLMNLPRLRDYSKAPFTLALVFLLGLLVTRRATRGTVLAVAAAYGIVLGIGYGFRPDFLANIPPFFLTLWGFLEGGVFRNLRLKSTAAALCLATFVVTGWPIISAVYRTGGCQWHVALLGFSARFSRPLGVEQPPYQLSRVYSDDFVATTATSYAARTQPGIGPIEYCKSEYDVQTGRYLRQLALSFPADMIVRVYASILRIVELAFTGRPVMQPGGNDHAENQAPGRPGASGPGLALVIVAVALALGADLRLGLFLLFFLMYFGGYPAIQFDVRHHFHLEFITWWAAGFVLQTAIVQVRPFVTERRWNRAWTPALNRASYALTGCAVAMAISLWAARVHQQASARSIFGAYLAAESDAVFLPQQGGSALVPIARSVPVTDPETAELLRIDVNASQCGEHEAVTFRYDSARHPEFWRTVFLNDRQTLHEPTHIFMPVYEGFQGIERAEATLGCISRISHVRNPGRFPMLLEAILSPQWETRPLYQRLGEVGFPDPDGTP